MKLDTRSLTAGVVHDKYGRDLCEIPEEQVIGWQLLPLASPSQTLVWFAFVAGLLGFFFFSF